MRHSILTCAAAMLAALPLVAQGRPDTTLVESLDKAVVEAVRSPKNAPFAVANVDRSTLGDFSKTGKELPLVLSYTPGVMSWSENGVGTGTTFLRIRGAGDSRINVTIDGVPLNSPEDQSVFWANMNGYSSFLESIQVQRGVGSSTNGDGAFGGSVALRTKAVNYDPYTEVNASWGSYNTYNTGFSTSSGLVSDHFVIDASYHHTGTDGFVHGTAGNSGSWYGAVTYLGRGFILKYRNIGNYEHTGQAWNGVTAGTGDLSLMDGTFGNKTGIKTYADMYAKGLGRYNSLYESLDTDTYALTRYRLNDGTPWPRTTDNFTQDHNILSLAVNLGQWWKATVTLHYTWGYGYYDEFRPENKLSKFGFAPFTDEAGGSVGKTDFIRKKGLDQDAGGAIFNASYKKDGWDLSGGLSAQVFSAWHFGYLTYVADPAVVKHYPVLKGLDDTLLDEGRYKYYDSDARKDDISAFVKASRAFGEHLSLFADLQYRYVGYRTWGINDKFIKRPDGTYANQVLDIDKEYGFFNPKAGLNYSWGASRAYASFAMSNREPERNNFTDNGSYPAPEAERVFDYEAGWQYHGNRLQAGVNLYYMDYTNQFVQTGALSDIGENLTTNIKDSYRAGVELAAGFRVAPWMRLEANAVLSRNRIKDFDEVVEDWDKGTSVIHYDNSTLAYSPSVIANGFAVFSIKGLSATWHTSYVGRQYLDNTANEDRSLPGYSLSGLTLRYPMKFKGFLRELELGLDVSNIFGAHVATSGWVYSAISASSGHPDGNRYYQIGFIPTAGTTAIGSVTLRF